MSSNYPDGMTLSDYDHVEGSRLEALYERWFEANEKGLIDEFLEEGWTEDDMGGKHWVRFVECAWDLYLNSCADSCDCDD